MLNPPIRQDLSKIPFGYRCMLEVWHKGRKYNIVVQHGETAASAKTIPYNVANILRNIKAGAYPPGAWKPTKVKRRPSLSAPKKSMVIG